MSKKLGSDKLISDRFIQLLVGIGLKPTPTSNYHYQKLYYLFLIGLVAVQCSGNLSYSKTKADTIKQIHEEVKGINRLVLKKTIHKIMSRNYESQKAVIYFDTKGRIRKVIYSWDVIPTVGHKTMYYKANGNLCYTGFSQINGAGGEGKIRLCGTIHFKDRQVIKIDTIKYVLRSKKVLRINSFPKGDAQNRTVKDLKKAFKLPDKRPSSGRYTFHIPSRGKTTIHKKFVLIQRKPNVKHNVPYKLYYSDQVTVLAVGKKESKGHWGKYKWYKISHLYPDHKSHKKRRVTGWVFGAFLEPVEEKL